MTFSDWPWRHWCRLRGDAPAVRLNDVVLSWRQLCAEVNALAAGFRAQGVNEGEGVLLRAYNQPSALLAWLALLVLSSSAAEKDLRSNRLIAGSIQFKNYL